MKKFSRSIFSTLWILIACALVSGAGLFLYVHHLRASLHAELVAYLDEVANQGVRILNTQIKGDVSSLQSAAAAISTYKNLENKPWAELLAEETKQNEFKRMAFILPDGVAYLSDGFLINLAHRDYFQRSMLGQNVISDPLRDTVDQGKAIILSVPVIGQDNAVRGVLIAAHPTDMYGDLIASDSFQGKGYSLIVKSNGDKVAVSAASRTDHSATNIFKSTWNKQLDLDGSMRKAMQEGKSGTVRFYRPGEGWLYVSYVPVGINDWYFLSVVPEQIATQKTKNLLYLSLILCGTGFLVFIFLLLYIYRQSKRNHNTLYQAAYVDPVLQRPNWAKIRQDIADLLTQTQEAYTFVVFDINKFKVLNDRWGYTRANELLKYISSVLEEDLQEGELFCRVQADVFALLLHMEQPEKLKNRLELLNEKIVNYSPAVKDHLQLILSFGVCPVENGQLSPSELFLRAALAKDTIKGHYNDIVGFYDDKLRQRMLQEQTIENEMEDALINQEFALLLTPIKDLTGQTMAAKEHTVWNPKDKPPVDTDTFLSVFTKNGFISRLDTYMAEEACRSLKHWQEQKQTIVPIALNVSAASLRSPYFSSVLLQLTRQYEVPAENLILQLSPRTDPADIPLLKQLAQRLHKEGFRLALNHFGRGTISLDLIQILPLDMVIMEGEFIRDVNNNSKIQPILESFVTMAQKLNLRLVFDGVENEEQLKLLKQMGSNWWTGPLAGTPVPYAHFFSQQSN